MRLVIVTEVKDLMVDERHVRSLKVHSFWLLEDSAVVFVVCASGLVYAYAEPKRIRPLRTGLPSYYGHPPPPLGLVLSDYCYLPRASNVGRRSQLILNILFFNLIICAAACLVLFFWPGRFARIPLPLLKVDAVALAH